MIKKSYYLTLDDETCTALTAIAERIPCFIWEQDGETVIECRDEDVAFVERMLAPVV